MSDQGDTPRTDAQEKNAYTFPLYDGAVPSYFSRTLERELAAANATIERLMKEVGVHWETRRALLGDMAERDGTIERLREALLDSDCRCSGLDNHVCNRCVALSSAGRQKEQRG